MSNATYAKDETRQEFSRKRYKKRRYQKARPSMEQTESFIENEAQRASVDKSSPFASIAEEYKGLVYNKFEGIVSPSCKSDETSISYSEKDTQAKMAEKRSSGDTDFRVKYKTEICKFWELNHECKFGDSCAFAHGAEDMRQKPNLTVKYKTKKCKQFFKSGYCPYGSRCQFLHECNIKQNCTYTSGLFFSYKKSLDILGDMSKLSNTEENKASPKRLKVFTLLVGEDSKMKDEYDNLFNEVDKIKRKLGEGDRNEFSLRLLEQETETEMN